MMTPWTELVTSVSQTSRKSLSSDGPVYRLNRHRRSVNTWKRRELGTDRMVHLRIMSHPWQWVLASAAGAPDRAREVALAFAGCHALVVKHKVRPGPPAGLSVSSPSRSTPVDRY